MSVRRRLLRCLGVAGVFAALAASALAATTNFGTAIEVPGTAALNTKGSAGVGAVACASAGNCTAGGFYQPGDAGGFDPFVVSQVHGTWGTAMVVPGMAALNQGGQAQVRSVSCASAGNCVAKCERL